MVNCMLKGWAQEQVIFWSSGWQPCCRRVSRNLTALHGKRKSKCTNSYPPHSDGFYVDVAIAHSHCRQRWSIRSWLNNAGIFCEPLERRRSARPRFVGCTQIFDLWHRSSSCKCKTSQKQTCCRLSNLAMRNWNPFLQIVFSPKSCRHSVNFYELT
jgi:hypothetical protein